MILRAIKDFNLWLTYRREFYQYIINVRGWLLLDAFRLCYTYIVGCLCTRNVRDQVTALANELSCMI